MPNVITWIEYDTDNNGNETIELRCSKCGSILKLMMTDYNKDGIEELQYQHEQNHSND